jgi:hypothetical protein
MPGYDGKHFAPGPATLGGDAAMEQPTAFYEAIPDSRTLYEIQPHLLQQGITLQETTTPPDDDMAIARLVQNVHSYNSGYSAEDQVGEGLTYTIGNEGKPTPLGYFQTLDAVRGILEKDGEIVQVSGFGRAADLARAVRTAKNKVAASRETQNT